MKRTFSITLAAMSAALFLSPVRISAQQNDSKTLGVLNHLSLGAGFGTTGVFAEAAAPVTPYLAVRAGMNWVPGFRSTTEWEISDDRYSRKLPRETDVQLKFKLGTMHLLFDIYPSKKRSFHFTVGAYFRGGEIISIRGKEPDKLLPVAEHNRQNPGEMVGYEFNNYVFVPDDEGNINGSMKVASCRPYIGFGFGRAVPGKHRFGVGFDMGVQLWGKPKFYSVEDGVETQLKKSDLWDDPDIVGKFSFWPVLNLRLVGKLL